MLNKTDIQRAQDRLSTRHGYRKEPARLTIEATNGGFAVVLNHTYFDGDEWQTESWPVGAHYETHEAAVAAFKGLGPDWRQVDDEMVRAARGPARVINLVTCEFCRTPGLQWVLSAGHYALHNAAGEHECGPLMGVRQ